MSNAEQVYQQQLLEPEQTIITGNAKRYGLLKLPKRSAVVQVVLPEPEPKIYKGNKYFED
jgi:hypothetical protein